MVMATKSTSRNREISTDIGIGENSRLPSQNNASMANEITISKSADPHGMHTLRTILETQPFSTPLTMSHMLSVTDLTGEDGLHSKLEKSFGRRLSRVVSQTNPSNSGTLSPSAIDITE